MCSLEALAAAASPLTPTESSVCHVGTQAGAPPPRWTSKPPLKHHSSELLLSPARVRVPLVPQTLGYSYIGYSNPGFTPPVYPGGRQSPPRGAANRARRRPPPPQYPADSPTSSLDCLPIRTDNWAVQAGDNNQGKMNGSVYGMLPDVSIRLGAPPPPPCRCPWGCGAEGGSEPRAPEAQSAEGLSWRRLHMSRAKLKATATTSELLSGFAMIAMVELQINEPTNVPEWLFVMFAVCTTVLVAVHIFALMISTYLLPNIDAVSKMSASDVLRESPHERMRGFIELAWAFSTVLGLFLFLVEIAILCWVKFWDYSFKAATAATIIVIPVLIVFVAFAVHFYHSLVVQKCDASNQDMEQLESMKRNLDNVTAASISPV